MNCTTKTSEFILETNVVKYILLKFLNYEIVYLA